MGVFRRLKDKITVRNFSADCFHPSDILVNIIGGRWVDWNLVHLLTLTEIVEKANAFLHFKIGEPENGKSALLLLNKMDE
jgi:hypothetical protein